MLALSEKMTVARPVFFVTISSPCCICMGLVIFVGSVAVLDCLKTSPDKDIVVPRNESLGAASKENEDLGRGVFNCCELIV